MKHSEIEGKNLAEISGFDRLVVIAHFRDDVGPVPQNPAVHFQLLLQEGNCSLSGKFIRFAHTHSEIHGWQVRQNIVVDELLGKLKDGSETEVEVLPREAEIIAIEIAA